VAAEPEVISAATANTATSVPAAPVPGVPAITAEVDASSGALSLRDAQGVQLAGMRLAVRSSGGKRASQARLATPQNRSIHDWRLAALGDAGWMARAMVRTKTGSWDVRLSQRDQAAPVQIQARFLLSEATMIGEEALVLRFSGLAGAEVLNRAYAKVPVSSGLTVDRWTPQRLSLDLGGGTASLEAKAESMRLEGLPSTVLQVVLHADHHGNHPYRPFEQCQDVHEDGVAPDRSKRSPSPRKAGDSLRVTARLHLGSGPELLPLRYPRGQRAALVFTDHADQSDLPKLRALMYGQSSGPEDGGFVGHGLSLTKTVFHRSMARRPIQLSDPDYAATLRALVGQGIEIGPHSVGDGPDKREKTAESLPAYAAIGGAPVWIDHQPSTNCEALSSQGADPSSRYFLVDQLKAQGYRYVWAGTDVAEPSDGINLFDPGRPRARPAVLYPHSAVDPDTEAPLMLFSSVWRYHDTKTFLDKFSDARLDKLEHDRGLHIAHTYLDSLSSAAGHRGKSLLVQEGDVTRIKPEVEAWLRGLSTRQSAGRLWVSGLVAVADHLVGMDQLRLDREPAGYRLRTQHAVRGASFMVPGRVVVPSVDGKLIASSQIRRDPDGTVFWLDLEAGSEHHLSWSDTLE
jgi:hypothetical protein